MSCPSLPGALIRGRRLRNRQSIRTRRRRTDAPQRHRFLQVPAADRELVAGELHAIDLPDAVAQGDPEAVAHQAPAGEVPAELRRAVAAHHDVADLIAGFRLPIPRQPDGCLRDREHRRSHDPEPNHPSNDTRLCSVLAPAGTTPATGATGSVSTATCPSPRFIIRTKAPLNSGSNSTPLRSSR